MVPRAVEVLQSVNLILAEDTRHTSRLLNHFGIATPQLAYHDHNEREAVPQLIERMQSGQNLALVSDAGTPLISDPGFELVRAAREAGLSVTPIPGACALILALSAAGLPVDRFSFVGFAPAKSAARKRWFEELKYLPNTQVLYESPHRILDCLQDLIDVLGSDRNIVIARELTKKHESWYRGFARSVLAEIRSDANNQRGEFVILVGSAEKEPSVDLAQAEHYMRLLLKELPVGKAASIASKMLGVSRDECYQIGLDISA